MKKIKKLMSIIDKVKKIIKTMAIIAIVGTWVILVILLCSRHVGIYTHSDIVETTQYFEDGSQYTAYSHIYKNIVNNKPLLTYDNDDICIYYVNYDKDNTSKLISIDIYP